MIETTFGIYLVGGFIGFIIGIIFSWRLFGRKSEEEQKQ